MAAPRVRPLRRVRSGRQIWAFSAGQMGVAYLLGASLTSVALLVSTTDICIPSMVYWFIFGGWGGLDSRPVE